MVWRNGTMYALIGRVKIKEGHEVETLAMIKEGGVPYVQSLPGFSSGYWTRNVDGELIQHSFWLFETEEGARAAERNYVIPEDGPATLVSVEVSVVVGQA
jgi:hypothetical protein